MRGLILEHFPAMTTTTTTHRTHANIEAGELNLIAELERTRTGRSVLVCGSGSPRASGLF